MPFCPNCRYEYVEGVARCPDCDEALVRELPPEPQEYDEPVVELVTVAEFLSRSEARMAKLLLEGDGIEGVVTGLGDYPARRIGTIRAMRLQVRPEDADRARAVLSAYNPDP